eukprot:m.10754 g.10754  ORF g.10754 m.10754 type:complete len:587 (+) comp3855_c0_seq2:365-2125(+)
MAARSCLSRGLAVVMRGQDGAARHLPAMACAATTAARTKTGTNKGQACSLRRWASTTSTTASSATGVFNADVNVDLSAEGGPQLRELQGFDDPAIAFESKSIGELARAYVVFGLCRSRSLVKHSASLYELSNKILGRAATAAALRATFFGHFCAGEDEDSIRPTVQLLQAHGIGGILDYAAESDLGVEEPYDPTSVNQPAQVPKYTSESDCDSRVAIFKDCILAVRNVTPEGFAAIKVTALGDPKLLRRVSQAITAARNLFQEFDTDNDGTVSLTEFRANAKRVFDLNQRDVDELFAALDSDQSEVLDYVEWSNTLRVAQMMKLMQQSNGPLAKESLSNEELELVKNMFQRLTTLATHAADNGVRLMIDAEQSYFQPAIDNVVLSLQEIYNREFPAIFNTYQAYLKSSLTSVQHDIERARRHGYHFGAKIVRGAYMVAERERAAKLGLDDPIHDTLQDTHNSYDSIAKYILTHQARAGNSEVLFATHNQLSIEKVTALMKSLGLDRQTGGVYFGQLLGMADHLTFTLGQSNYKAYKYVPYGQVHEVVPYLIRRAQENGDMLGGTAKERAMIGTELRSRFRGGAPAP